MRGLNVYLRKDGRWEGRIVKGKRENGTRRFQYIFAKTKEEVIEKIMNIKAQEYQDAECDKLFAEVYDKWLRSVRYKIKESTITNYAMKATKHLLPFFGDKSIVSISHDDIYAFIDKKFEETLSKRYINDIIVLMKSIVKFAVKAYHVFNPLDGITMPKSLFKI